MTTIYREDNAITGETIFYDEKGNLDIFTLKSQIEMKNTNLHHKIGEDITAYGFLKKR